MPKSPEVGDAVAVSVGRRRTGDVVMHGGGATGSSAGGCAGLPELDDRQVAVDDGDVHRPPLPPSYLRVTRPRGPSNIAAPGRLRQFLQIPRYRLSEPRQEAARPPALPPERRAFPRTNREPADDRQPATSRTAVVGSDVNSTFNPTAAAASATARE